MKSNKLLMMSGIVLGYALGVGILTMALEIMSGSFPHFFLKVAFGILGALYMSYYIRVLAAG